MAVTNLYPNLPGHLVEFKDGGLQLTSKTVETSTTKSLLILGTATDGPINEPVKIDATTVSQVFGKEVDAQGYPNGTTITKYARQAFKNGFDDVRCMRITGTQAYTTIDGEQVTGSTEGTPVSVNGSGVLNGNDQDVMEIYDNNTSTLVLAPENITDDGVFKDNNDNVLDFSSLQKNPYAGITIPANKFGTAVSSLTYTSDKGLEFTKTLGEIFKEETITFQASTGVPNDESNPTSYSYTAEFRLGSGEKFFEGYTGTDSILLDILPGTSQFTAGYPFYITDTNDLTFVAVNDDTTGELIGYDITLTVAEELQTDIDRTIKYWPYTEANITKTLALTTNAYTVDCSSDISTLKASKTVVESSVAISSVKITKNDNTIVLNSTNSFATDDVTATIADGVVSIENISGALSGATVEVVITYEVHTTRSFKLKVSSQWGGSLYKDGKVAVTKEDGYTQVIFTKPTKKTQTAGVNTFGYSSKYYHTVDDLIFAMNNDINNVNLFTVEILEGEGSDPLDLLLETEAKELSEGGDDGINPTNDEMFIALSGDRYTESDVNKVIDGITVEPWMVGYLKHQGAYQILENYNVDYIYPAGVYADAVQNVNPHSDFQRELALVCAVLTYRTKMTHGFIDVKPNSNTTLIGIDKYVNNLISNHANLYYMTDSNGEVVYDENENPMDIGWYTSCVVGPEVIMTSDTLGTYYGSPAIAYAALNAVIEPQSAPTNKALRNVRGMKFKLSNKQLDALTANRMVCFKLKNEGSVTASNVPYVVDGVTSGARNCDYTRLSTVKVLTDVVDQIREVADPFIGEQNTVEQRNALSALIAKRLAKLVELGEIQAYEFEVSATIQQQLLGEASIALTIIPALELRRITTVVALRAAQ